MKIYSAPNEITDLYALPNLSLRSQNKGHRPQLERGEFILNHQVAEERNGI
jgi:hypothetical protein